MTRILDATFDGEVFRPDTPPGIEPNTRVKLAVDEQPDSAAPDSAARRHALMPPAERLERIERLRKWVHESPPIQGSTPPPIDRESIYLDHD